jgi:hypothetical protein
MSNDLYQILFEEVDNIENSEELYSLIEILKMYRRIYTKMTIEQRKEYFEKIVRMIFVYSSKSQINSKNSKKLLSLLSSMLDSNDDLYLLAMYSHMIFVFSNIKEVNTDNLKTKNIPCYWLTSSYDEVVEEFATKHQLEVTFGATDDITLKTIVRANPGLVLLKQGTVVAKWHHNALPDISEIYQLIN